MSREQRVAEISRRRDAPTEKELRRTIKEMQRTLRSMAPRLFRSLAAELLALYPPPPAPPPRAVLTEAEREAQRRSAWHSAAPDVAAVVARLEAAGFSYEEGGRVGGRFFRGGFGHCASVAIAKGHLRFGGAAAELDAPARRRDGAALEFASHEYAGDCGHTLRPSLRSLLLQPDFGGSDYDEGRS